MPMPSVSVSHISAVTVNLEVASCLYSHIDVYIVLPNSLQPAYCAFNYKIDDPEGDNNTAPTLVTAKQ